jgi:hypothetical protein
MGKQTIRRAARLAASRCRRSARELAERDRRFATRLRQLTAPPHNNKGCRSRAAAANIRGLDLEGGISSAVFKS